MTTVLRQVVTALRDGTCAHEDGYLRLPDRIGRSAVRNHCVSHQLGGGSVNEFVAGIDAPAGVQQLYLNDAARVDLAELAPLTGLREISVNRAGAVTGAVPRELPVEALALEAARIDVDIFSDLPHLWHLELSGGLTSMTPLLAIGTLSVLDLSGCDIDDLELLTELPALRVLTLNPRQWHRLRQADRIPPGLAAAVMTGRTRLAETLDWKEALLG